MSYPRPVEDYFSSGFRNLVVAICSHQNRSEAHFPYGCHETRISSQDSVHTWFTRLVDNQLKGRVEECAVETNMGVFAHLRYRDGLIAYANIQVIVAEADLETFYLDDKTPCSYFRFDYDLDCLGKMFKEPQPHVHTVPEGAPRFGQHLQRGNAVVDFFDFIYRNYHHAKWISWARYAYSREGPALGREEDVFKPIEEAFKANKHQELVSIYGNSLGHVKAACCALKDKLFAARIDITTAATLGYESAAQ